MGVFVLDVADLLSQPFIYDETKQVMISYDDAQSFGMFPTSVNSFYFDLTPSL